MCFLSSAAKRKAVAARRRGRVRRRFFFMNLWRLVVLYLNAEIGEVIARIEKNATRDFPAD